MSEKEEANAPPPPRMTAHDGQGGRKDDGITKREPHSPAVQTTGGAAATQATRTKSEPPPTADAEPPVPANQPTDAAVIQGLIALLTSGRDEVRSRRLLLLSNLVVAFTIPLSALAVQEMKLFKTPKVWLIPEPAILIFFSWFIGILVMLRGLYFVYQSTRKDPELLASHRGQQAVKFMVAGDTKNAIDQLERAIEKEHERLDRIEGGRKYFYWTLLAFLICITLEFLLCLFA
ncbi:MAG TPA: hypothetical protein VKA70_09265 [Blastocatellia bacterium]|nr:hypothetical protein [Blastocatellia bacterium]